MPKINLRQELKQLCSKYGSVKMLFVENKYKTEIFTECYHVLYEKIQSARFAKRLIDTKSFYGGVLHVCYAPEYETIEEIREKLEQRRKDVAFRLKKNAETYSENNLTDNNAEDAVPNNTLSYKDPKLKTWSNQKNDKRKSFPKQESRKRKHPAIILSEDRLKNLNKNVIWKDIPREIDPRINSEFCKKIKTDIKKHYTIQTDKIIKQNLPSYGPELPQRIPSVSNEIISNSNCATATSSKNVLKKQICQNVKRIVFMNNKNIQKS